MIASKVYLPIDFIVLKSDLAYNICVNPGSLLEVKVSALRGKRSVQVKPDIDIDALSP